MDQTKALLWQEETEHKQINKSIQGIFEGGTCWGRGGGEGDRSSGGVCRDDCNRVTSEQRPEDREEGRSHMTIWRTFQTRDMERS